MLEPVPVGVQPSSSRTGWCRIAMRTVRQLLRLCSQSQVFSMAIHATTCRNARVRQASAYPAS
eukprot:scaffold1347_cov350-Pavlova_lutheri.AAC.44